MYPAYEIVQRAYDWYFQRDNIAYWMGAKGEVLTRSRMEDLVRWNPEYFAKYTPAQLEKLMQWSEGKTGFDCSGLVSKCVGVQGWSSWTLWEHCKEKVGVKECKGGSLLWRPGHIGIDLSFGAVLHIGVEGETIRIDDNGSKGFQFGGQWENADYSMMYSY